MNFQESERTSAISNYSVGSGSARRNSARKSFVRGALVEEEERARSTAARVTFMKNGVERKISASSLAWQIKLGDFVRSSFFTNFVMLLIVGNAVLLGVEIDISSRVGQYEVPLWFGIVNTILVFIFVTETILKLLAVGCNEFWKGEECLWNGFDFVIVSLSVAETVIDWLAQTMSSSADGSNSFRIMRALRLARTLRSSTYPSLPLLQCIERSDPVHFQHHGLPLVDLAAVADSILYLQLHLRSVGDRPLPLRDH